MTGRDTHSWQDKSWIVGVLNAQTAKAYDWNQLMREKLIYDTLDNKPILIVLLADKTSFVALERETPSQSFELIGDTLISDNKRYNILGKSLDGGLDLLPIKAYQEHWHSWQAFHPNTRH